MAFGIQIPARVDGTAAADGNPITNLGGYTSNGADVGFVQTDPSFIDTILVSGTGGGLDTRVAYHGIVNGKPAWNNGSFPTDYILWSGTVWQASTVGATWERDGDTGFFPPKTGWVVTVGSPAGNPTLDFASVWVDDSTDTNIQFKTLTHPDLLLLDNGTKEVLMQWEKLGPSDICHMIEGILFEQGTQAGWTENQYNQAVSWAGDPTCGAGFDPFP